MVRIIGLDFDGTIYWGEDTRKWGEKLGEAIEELLGKGVSVGVVSSRSREDVQRILPLLGIRDSFPRFHITETGMVFDGEGKEYPGCEENNREVREILKDFYKLMEEIKEEVKEFLLNSPFPPREIRPAIEWGGYLYLYSSPEIAEKARKFLLDKNLPSCVRITRNLFGIYLTRENLNKGRGIDALRRSLSLPPQDVLVIGDSLNDLPMMDEKLGFKVATPGSADPLVKEKVIERTGIVARSSFGEGTREILLSFLSGRLK